VAIIIASGKLQKTAVKTVMQNEQETGSSALDTETPIIFAALPWSRDGQGDGLPAILLM
jgi:hypothetical protein